MMGRTKFCREKYTMLTNGWEIPKKKLLKNGWDGGSIKKKYV